MHIYRIMTKSADGQDTQFTEIPEQYKIIVSYSAGFASGGVVDLHDLLNFYFENKDK